MFNILIPKVSLEMSCNNKSTNSFFFKFMGARLTITLLNFTEGRATSTQQIQYNCDISFMDCLLLGNVGQLCVPLTISQEVDGITNGFVDVYLVPDCYQRLFFKLKSELNF